MAIRRVDTLTRLRNTTQNNNHVLHYNIHKQNKGALEMLFGNKS